MAEVTTVFSKVRVPINSLRILLLTLFSDSLLAAILAKYGVI